MPAHEVSLLCVVHQANIWAEPKGGGKTAGGAKPRKDGPSETIFGDPPKTVFEGVT